MKPPRPSLRYSLSVSASAGCPQVVLDELLDRVRVGDDEEIEPAVVVVVEPPGREAGERLLHLQLRRHLLEGAVAAIAVEEVVAEHVRRVEVGEAVVVVVAPRHALGEGVAGDAGADGDILEGAVAPVAIEPAGRQLVSDVDIDPAVVVVVGPGRRVGGEHAVGETGRPGHVGEHAGAVVAQQRVAHRDLPATAMDEQVEIAVVVVVGVAGVEAAQLRRQARGLGAVLEGAVAAVAIEARRGAEVDRRQHDVEPAVAVEVVDDGAAGGAVGADAGLPGDVGEARRRHLRAEQVGRQAMLRRHAVRVSPEQHRRQVQLPARLEVGRFAIGQPGEDVEGGLGTGEVVVASTVAQRKQAAIRVGHHQAVVDLALAHRGDADRLIVETPAGRQIRIVGGERLQGVARGGEVRARGDHVALRRGDGAEDAMGAGPLLVGDRIVAGRQRRELRLAGAAGGGHGLGAGLAERRQVLGIDARRDPGVHLDQARTCRRSRDTCRSRPAPGPSRRRDPATGAAASAAPIRTAEPGRSACETTAKSTIDSRPPAFISPGVGPCRGRSRGSLLAVAAAAARRPPRAATGRAPASPPRRPRSSSTSSCATPRAPRWSTSGRPTSSCSRTTPSSASPRCS